MHIKKFLVLNANFINKFIKKFYKSIKNLFIIQLHYFLYFRFEFHSIKNVFKAKVDLF